MRKALSFVVVIAALLLVPAFVGAVPIPISGTGVLGSFDGSFDYNPGTATVSISLTNTSPAANGGFITAFVFNLPDSTTVTASTFSSSDPDFGQLGGPTFNNSVNGAPFGRFDIGASTGGGFPGGGNPNVGIAVGGSATFSYVLTGTGLGSVTAATFLSSLSVPPGAGGGLQTFVVRFRGFEDGGSDRVPGIPGVTGVPEPTTSLLLGLGLASVLASRFRSARK